MTPDRLSETAPTLADLKKLPIEEKCRFLLARLARIGRDINALSKHNLMMPGDPFSLAYGYPDAEKTSVREHLLGAPWTRLVNEGYLVDLHGQGFYKVTEEGKEYIDREELPARPSPDTAGVSPEAPGVPRAFLSYSWDSPEHTQWVTKLAERLHGESGVQIVFDQWHLNPGDDRLHFMERSVRDSDFVIVICTPEYAERANKREGGVGYESMVITAEMAEHILTNKFIPVLRNGTWVSSLPIYLRSRMGVDLSGEPYGADEYEKLVRVLHKELLRPPPLGTKPEYLTKPMSNQQPTDLVAAEAKDLSQKLEQWLKESQVRWETVLRERISAAHPEMYFRHGTWSIGYMIAGDLPHLRLSELLEVLRGMPQQTRCLHPWGVPSSDERKPYPIANVLECWPAPTHSSDGYSPDFWRAAVDFRMFYLRKYEEDEYDEDNRIGSEGSKLLVKCPIWRTGECVLHAARLGSVLQVSSATVTFRATWTGLKGRRLCRALSGPPIANYQCRQDSMESTTAVSVGEVEPKLQEIVTELLTPLYEAFNLFALNTSLVQTELSEMLQKCADGQNRGRSSD